MTVRFAAALSLAAALGLAACSGEAEEETYEVDATDESGGELIVADEEAQGVPVDVPETEMTNVPPEEMEEGMPQETNAPDE
ncbi:hypothetical protein [Alteriqipengyuania lutimaris]|uniref:Argininosuccinate lyase n=1 Tax=Alteriqipengyuania lutimaris TaxID=1538146 RepID=A0A395LJ28_9SPHN|nr:hypothetical protein [Alteriqipengyuania lutimaris]MBB3034090.1 putative lipoprotein YmbA [Alteriqipengyuania lutimaris]RDS76973.1 hypothetical protein DL238_04690 [Alteriqipengyuania lutimaris]